jgi:hypothetical protein
MQQPETPASQSVTPITTGALVPQPHGGALRNGGTNKGGMGRVPTRVRRLARESFYRVIPRLAAIAEGENIKQTAVLSIGNNEGSEIEHFEGPAKPSDQIKAAAVLAQVGMGENISAEDVKARLVAQTRILIEELGPEAAEPIIKRLGKQVWR